MNETPRAKNWYESESDFNEALEQAEANARTDWEMEFVSDQQRRAQQFGFDMYLTESQYETLRRISER